LRQWESAKHLECKPHSPGYNEARKRNFFEDPYIPTEKMYLFGKVRSEMQEIGVLPFLTSGTLLGEFFVGVFG
jgi:hypothetical protein